MKSKIYKIFLAILLVLSSSSFAGNDNSTYSFTLAGDKDMSSASSAEIAMSALEAYRVADDRLFQDSDNIAVKILGYAARFTMPYWISVANHEVGGHGGRAREFNIKVTKYQINPFDGSTYFGNKYNSLTLPQQIAITTGGIQASHLFAENIKARYLEKNSINPAYGSGYFASQGDQPDYIFSLKKDEKDLGDDVYSYINELNKSYGYQHIDRSKLKKYALLDLVDPFLYYSIYSFVMNKTFEVPMIEYSNIRYLPSTRAVLAPYGLEMRLHNHFVFNDKYVQINLTYGKKKDLQPKSYGVSLKTRSIIDMGNVSLGAELAYWSQPDSFKTPIIWHKTKRGYLANANAELILSKNIAIVLSGGYKTAGFYEGTPLKKSVLLRGGLKLDF